MHFIPYVFEDKIIKNTNLVRFILFQRLKKICITPPSKFRISATSTFLVIDIKYIYKHKSMVGDKQRVFNRPGVAGAVLQSASSLFH